VHQKSYTKTIAYERSGHFSNLERKIFVSKKKVLQPKSISKKNKNLVLRVWFALLNYKKNTTIQNFNCPLFFTSFRILSKTKKISFPNVKILKKKMKKTQPCVYIKKEEKRNQKNFYCSCCCNLTKKTLSKTLYV